MHSIVKCASFPEDMCIQGGLAFPCDKWADLYLKSLGNFIFFFGILGGLISKIDYLVI